jgi:undecaprenyl-diphosphatase
MKLCLCGSRVSAEASNTASHAAMPKWLKAYGWWIFFWAFMVSVSRIFVGKHYLGDVLVGILVGSIAGYCFARLAGYTIKKCQL